MGDHHFAPVSRRLAKWPISPDNGERAGTVRTERHGAIQPGRHKRSTTWPGTPLPTPWPKQAYDSRTRGIKKQRRCRVPGSEMSDVSGTRARSIVSRRRGATMPLALRECQLRVVRGYRPRTAMHHVRQSPHRSIKGF
jgi:hypothetical protein